MFVHPPADSILEPFRMPYGFHLLKFLGYRPIPPFAEAEKELRTTYQGQRYQADYNRYLQQLARAYPVSVDSAVLKELSISFDTTKVSMADTWSDTLSASIRAKTLVTVGGRPTTVQQFADRITGSNQFRPTTLNPAAVLSMIPPLVENLVVEEHGRAVARRDPEFIALMKEYEDGILLYRIEQDELWKKIVLTDTLLQEYFTAHRDSYRWPDRVNFAEIYLPNDSLARMCAKELRSGKEFGAVVVAHSIRQQYVEKKGEWGLQPVAMNELTQRAALMRVDSVSEPFRFQNGWSIIKTIAKEESRLKTFEEARPEVTTTYQDIAAKQREQQWLEELRAKHPIAIKGDVLREAFKRTPRDAR
jgi:peptidyl-prolyl cis-trans isomerase SurA